MGFTLAVSTRDWLCHTNSGTLHTGYFEIAGGSPTTIQQQSVGNYSLPAAPSSSGPIAPDTQGGVIYMDSVQFTQVTIGQLQYTFQLGAHSLNGWGIEAAYIPVELFASTGFSFTVTNYASQIALMMVTYVSVPKNRYDKFIKDMAEALPDVRGPWAR